MRESPLKASWWKKKDVKQTFILWIFFTVAMGFIGGEVQARSMGVPASETMETVISLIRIFTWAAAPFAGLVFAMAATSLLKKPHYGDTPPEEADHEIRNSPRANAVWMVASALLCLFALIMGLVALQRDNKSILDSKAMTINVTGQQWVWNYDYAGTNGVRSSVLHLPVNQAVLFKVTSKDVKHSFWIVQMGIKIDANPGYITETAVTPNKIGTFDIRCAELCGLLHAYMQNKVIVQSRADYDAWIASQPNTAPANGGNA